MGPGPIDVYPRVSRAMAMPMLGQFDPEFTGFMNETMELYRQVFRTRNQWTFLIDGTARAGIEACLGSLIAHGDKVLVPMFGRFGHLLAEIAFRAGGHVISIEAEWGTVFTTDQIAEAVRHHRPRVLALVHGDTSTTMMQPFEGLAEVCRETDTLFYSDATASIAGNPFDTDTLGLDAVSTGLQKCMSGPPGTSPITLSDRAAAVIDNRRHIEGGIKPEGAVDATGPRITSNYLDLAMIMDYWSPKRLNHHTEATSMLYAAHECARVVLEEGLDTGQARHRLTSRALRGGLEAMGLKLFGDAENRMANVTGVVIPDVCGDGEALRAAMLNDFGIEIGTSFGPLAGKIWRIGTMGYVCRKANVLRCLASLDASLRRSGYEAPANAGIDAAYDVYDEAGA
ncbi:MAG: alanine--glyoxylate aminotransferase family protein [Silicimonas sp.]|nr:alanine--glyoxylate aminotransferase family protein [Silicimonas sp.]